MKRRVLRSHSNKKVLRVISATHSVSIAARGGGGSGDDSRSGERKRKAVPVLCDSSFIRALLLACPAPSTAAKGDREADQRQPPRASHPHPRTLLPQLCDEAFSVFDTDEEKRKKKSRQARGDGGGRESGFIFYYMPETRAALERLLSRGGKEGGKEAGTDDARGEGARPGGGAHRPAEGRHCFTEIGVAALLASMRLLKLPTTSSSATASPAAAGEDDDKSAVADATATRNEAKALKDAAERLGSGGSAGGRAVELLAKYSRGKGRAHGEEDRGHGGDGVSAAAQVLPLVFVATQSHDVRRLLPLRTPLLRLTTNPPSLWIEQNDMYAAKYEKERRGSSGVAVSASASATATAAAAAPRLSAADRSFMAFITGGGSGGERTLSRESRLAAARGADMHGHTPANSAAAATSTPAGPSATGTATAAPERPKSRKRHASKQPNPLSVKKKQKREVFRVN